MFSSDEGDSGWFTYTTVAIVNLVLLHFITTLLSQGKTVKLHDIAERSRC